MKKADLGKHCLLLHNPGFPRWHHIYRYGLWRYCIFVFSDCGLHEDHACKAWEEKTEGNWRGKK